MASANRLRGKVALSVCCEHFRRTTCEVLAHLSKQDVDSLETRLCDDMLAEGEDCVICSTWRLEDGNSAHPIVVRITTQAMYRFRSAHYSQRADMSARFASNLQMYILDGHYDVGDTSPPAFTIVVDDLFLLETR